MKRKIDSSAIVLIAGIIMALITAILIVYGQQYYNQLVPVVYCGDKDIPPYTIIKETDIVERNVPKAVIERNNVFIRKEDVIGKVTVTLICAGTPIIRNQVMDLKRNSNLLSANLTRLDDPEVVAFTIPANPLTAAGGKIRANDRVSIIGSMEISLKPGQPPQKVTQVIVPEARVLDVIGEGNNIKGLTFALTLQQVLDIEFVQKRGSIVFALLPYQYNSENFKNTSITEKTFIKRYFSSKSKEVNN